MNTEIKALAAVKPSNRYFRIKDGRYAGCIVKEGSRGFELQKVNGLEEVLYIDIKQDDIVIFKGVSL